MKWTLNLYQDDKYPFEKVKRALESKNPVIFVVPASGLSSPNILEFINQTRTLAKAYTVLNSCDVLASVSYLLSFREIKTRQILVVAPKTMKDNAVQMVNESMRVLNKYFADKEQK